VRGRPVFFVTVSGDPHQNIASLYGSACFGQIISRLRNDYTVFNAARSIGLTFDIAKLRFRMHVGKKKIWANVSVGEH
jgi:hypothetical protein